MVKGCWLIKGQHKLLAVAVDIVCAVSPNDADAGGDDDGAV